MSKGLLKLMLGTFLVVFAMVLTLGALHSILATGTCSSNGYSSQLGGRVPTCPKGSGWYDVFLPVSLVLSIIGAAALPKRVAPYGIPALFSAFGITPLWVAFGGGPTGPGKTFLFIFGGCLLAAAIGGAAAIAWSQRKNSARHTGRRGRAGQLVAGLVAGLAAIATAVGLLSVTAPDSAVSATSASGPARVGDGTGALSTSVVEVPLAPDYHACQLLTTTIAQQALGFDAHQTRNWQGTPGTSECDYASASGGTLSVEVVADWTIIKPHDQSQMLIAGLDNHAYLPKADLPAFLSDTNISLGLVVHIGQRGLRIILTPLATEQAPRQIGDNNVAEFTVARAILPQF